MKSLFAKIFCWFWVSHVLLLSVALLSTMIWPGNQNISSLAPPPRPDFARVVLLLGIGTGVSFALARYLAAPALALRDATRRLANGDLTARAGPQIGARRDELADLGRDFDLMAGRMAALVQSERHAVEVQRRLIADVSHELRSPLARLTFALELVERENGAHESEYLSRIGRETGRLNLLVSQLLTLARLENGSENAREVVDLAAIVAGVAEDADFEAARRGCHVWVTHLEPCQTTGDEGLLRSAIENIVRNAVRYTGENTVVEIALRCEGNEGVSISVRDYGPGVPEASLSELFRPFYRVEEARDRRSGGTGLGLSIAERAVCSHGGTLTARNAEGGGLLLELRLPRAVAGRMIRPTG